MRPVRDIAREFMGRGGKRLRPRLCRIVYDALGGGDVSYEARQGDIGMVCDAVECFHKASLVHDDIQDGDLERYGRPSVHAEFGVPLAVAVGDWLVAEGYRLLAASGFPRTADMLAAAAGSHLQLSEGQGDELAMRLSGGAAPAREDVLSVYRRKTGEAFALAARLGAIAALGASDARSAALERELVRFGLAFGVVFQIRDDLADGESPLSGADLEVASRECAAAAGALPFPALSAALLSFLASM